MERRHAPRRKHRKAKEGKPSKANIDECQIDRVAETLSLSLALSNGTDTNGDLDHDHDRRHSHDRESEPRPQPQPQLQPRKRPPSEVDDYREETAAPEETATEAERRSVSGSNRSSECELCGSETCVTPGDVRFESYRSELQMGDIMKLIQKDLSEPYSIYTYRYFIHNWPKLCFLAVHDSKCVGAIVCKLDLHRTVKRGYIAMLAVDQNYRKRKIGSQLVSQAIHEMITDMADEVVLETEITNKPALKLYENLGFVRDKRLFRYYLNGVDALRLKLWLR